MVSLAGAPSLPDAHRAAARLGCQETFAIVSDERAPGVRRVWLAEQVELSRYDMRELLGEDWINKNNDRFALLYMQAAQHSVNWLLIEQGCPDGPYEIRDEYGQRIIKRMLKLRDAYTKGPVLSEAAFCARKDGDVVWAEVRDPTSGKLIAEAPARITAFDKQADRVRCSLDGADDTGHVAAAKLKGLAAGLQSMGATPSAAQGVASAVANTVSKLALEFEWVGDPSTATGSACENEDGTIKLFATIDVRDDEDEDEDEDEPNDEDESECDEPDEDEELVVVHPEADEA